MTAGRVPAAALAAGLGGVVLLGSLWLPWFGIEAAFAGEDGGGAAIAAVYGGRVSGWAALSAVDVLLVAAAVLLVRVPLLAAMGTGGRAAARDGAVAAAVAVLLVVAGLVAPPNPVDEALVRVLGDLGLSDALPLSFYDVQAADRRVGAWLALAGALAGAAGAGLAARQPRTRNQRRHLVVLAGGLLLLAALWQPWYALGGDLGGAVAPDGGVLNVIGGHLRLSAWQVLTFADVALAALATAAIAAGLLGAGRRVLAVVAIGALAGAVLVVARLAWLPAPDPGSLSGEFLEELRTYGQLHFARERGGWVALAAALLVVGGAGWAARQARP